MLLTRYNIYNHSYTICRVKVGHSHVHKCMQVVSTFLRNYVSQLQKQHNETVERHLRELEHSKLVDNLRPHLDKVSIIVVSKSCG